MTQTHSASQSNYGKALHDDALHGEVLHDDISYSEALHDDASYSEALHALRSGKAIVFPTDTLFGLGVSVQHATSPEVLYCIKHREKRKPIAWLVDSADALDTYGIHIPSYAKKLAQSFWPGALTIIVKASEAVPEAFRSEQGTIGMRMPANVCALELIAQLGCPIATTSANISGGKNVLSFSDLDPRVLSRVAAAISDEEEKSGVASTIVDCTLEDGPLLLREGAITAKDILALV